METSKDFNKHRYNKTIEGEFNNKEINLLRK